jgi:hypothetical protein
MTHDRNHTPPTPPTAMTEAVYDPSKNVLDLVDAANTRQDDMREALARRIDSEIAALKHHLEQTMLERDKRYEHRYDAIAATVETGLASQKEASRAALDGQKEAIQAALVAQKEAVAKAEASAEKRFEVADKTRLEQAEQQRLLMPRAESESRFVMLSEKISVLEGFRTEQLSKGSGAKEGYGFAIGVVGLVLVLLSIISVGMLIFSRLNM